MGNAMNVLMTGGSGEIGGIVRPGLLDKRRFGFNIDVYDYKSGDDVFDVPKLFKRMQGKDAVIHLAAIGGPGRRPNPYSYERINGDGFRTVLRTASYANVPKLIYASSDAVYGPTHGNLTPTRFPLHEDTPPPPEDTLHVYTKTKIAADKWAKNFANATDMVIIGLRIWPHTPYVDNYFNAPHGRQADWLYAYILWVDLQEAFGLAVETEKVKSYVVCNIATPTTPAKYVDIQKWIKSAWPDVPNFTTGQETLVDISRAQKYLNYHPEFKRAIPLQGE